MPTRRAPRAPHIRLAMVILSLFLVLNLLNPVYAASAPSQSGLRHTHLPPRVRVEGTFRSLDREPQASHLAPRGRWGDGSQRYAPARFTYRPPVEEEKPPVLIATKPLPSNRPNPKPHAKGYKGYLNKLHSVLRSPSNRFPMKFKIKSLLGAYGKKNGKVRPLTYETADFNWKSKYRDTAFLHRMDKP